MGTKNKPGKFDCYANAEPDEPMFVLLGRDPTASIIVGQWCELRNALHPGEDRDKITEAADCMQAMSAWAAKLGKTQKIQRSILAWDQLNAARNSADVKLIAAYLLDRADQYETRSPCWVALVDAAKNIVNYAHVAAEQDGTIDDELMKRIDGMVRDGHRPIAVDPTAGVDD